MAIVSLDTAKAHLRVDVIDEVRERDILRKIVQAEAIIIDYLKRSGGSPPVWTDETDTPPLVVAAILFQLAELDGFRGDELGALSVTHTTGELSPWVTNVLRRYRDPALA